MHFWHLRLISCCFCHKIPVKKVNKLILEYIYIVSIYIYIDDNLGHMTQRSFIFYVFSDKMEGGPSVFHGHPTSTPLG